MVWAVVQLVGGDGSEGWRVEREVVVWELRGLVRVVYVCKKTEAHDKPLAASERLFCLLFLSLKKVGRRRHTQQPKRKT